ncbi:MAG: hypothetical protein HQ500_10540 [Flavobacteriales bacterium]|nr:hypothetical protein [Flavobacteriales bacterium]
MQHIDLRQEMEQAQVEFDQNNLLRAAKAILNVEFNSESNISSRIVEGGRRASSNEAWIAHLDPNRRFNLEAIERICTKFRLRFLESDLFKGDVPADAVREVKRLESSLGVQFSAFKILAPAERFHLKDSTKDPMLLAELPNGQFYYIFQWGDDMKWYQHLLKYPFRHIGALAASSSLIGLMIAFLVPSQFEAIQAEFFFRFFMFSMTTCLIMTLAIISAIIYSKDFSENVWNSKFIR